MYNVGMLVEVGIHYYNVTGETKLPEVTTCRANPMAGYVRAFPKKDMVPAHSDPEKTLIRPYIIYKNNLGLKKQTGVPVAE